MLTTFIFAAPTFNAGFDKQRVFHGCDHKGLKFQSVLVAIGWLIYDEKMRNM
jgi:hypothetical protein